MPRPSRTAPLPGFDEVLPAASPWVAVLDDALTAELAVAARGPVREGLFALWLVARTAADAAERFAVAAPLWRTRHEALAQRLSSVTLAAPLRRALTSAMSMLRTPSAADGALVLAQLVAPARDVLGEPTGRALATAAAAAKGAQLTSPRPA